MTYNRGSLKQCLRLCINQWNGGYDGFLAIVCNPRGKYYTVMEPRDLTKHHSGEGGGHQRLTFYGTRRELMTICNPDQIDMFEPKGDHEESPSVQTGEFDCHDAGDRRARSSEDDRGPAGDSQEGKEQPPDPDQSGEGAPPASPDGHHQA